MKAKIRQGDLIASVELTVRVPAGIMRYLEELVGTGLHGSTPEQAAHWLIADGINRRIDSGWIPLFEFHRDGSVRGIRRP